MRNHLWCDYDPESGCRSNRDKSRIYLVHQSNLAFDQRTENERRWFFCLFIFISDYHEISYGSLPEGSGHDGSSGHTKGICISDNISALQQIHIRHRDTRNGYRGIIRYCVINQSRSRFELSLVEFAPCMLIYSILWPPSILRKSCY